jgi:FtsP/CotA-like multicopper oxidase with cupredoxin domain
VTALVEPSKGAPDVRIRLVAARSTIRLASGKEIEALTFNGRSPGPEIRARTGDVVEVDLANRDVDAGVTIHWHGLDVPNAEDGVAGVTQNAVLPGRHHIYRFRVDQSGTFWYHTHQVSSTEVRRGLLGAIVVDPPSGRSPGIDLTEIVHTYDGVPTLNGGDGLARRAVPPGTPVRLRLVNTDASPQRLVVSGVPFAVVAIDGVDLNGPTPLTGTTLELAAGGRYDVAFRMPPTAVRLSLAHTPAALALSRTGTESPAALEPPERLFDPATYGVPARTPFDARSRFDRRFTLTIGRKPGFLDGQPGLQWSLNGGIYPRVPMFVVRRGDLVLVTVVNDTKAVHPMHLHGHHMLVLSRDGAPTSGSPWWIDTLDVRAGERYDLAFRADNPGIWMDHCHNLSHAAAGLTMHVVYEGVTTPYLIGGETHNLPE